jgi:hypothetical protein
MEIAEMLEFVCTICAPHAMEIGGDFPILPPTPAQEAEVRRYL